MSDIDSTQTHNHHPLQDAVFKHSPQLGNKIEDFSFLRNRNAEVEQTELWNLASHLWVQAGFQYVNVVRWNLSLWHLSYSVLLKVYILLVLLLLFRLLVVLCSFPDLSALTDTCRYQPFLCQLGTRQCPICEKFLCFWSLQQQLLQQIHGASYMTNSMRNQNNIVDRQCFRWIVACHLSWQSHLLVIVPCCSRFEVQKSNSSRTWTMYHHRSFRICYISLQLHENQATSHRLCINPQRSEDLNLSVVDT